MCGTGAGFLPVQVFQGVRLLQLTFSSIQAVA
jgi:hypothetical protein